MRKLLVLFFVGILAISCSKVSYEPFFRETLQPQAQVVVDSILGEHSDFLKWNYWDSRGVRNTDSCTITTFYKWVELKKSKIRNVSVITYTVTDTVTVKSRIIDR